MKRKITGVQIITIVLVVLYIVWEKNVQEHMTTNNIEMTYENRKDLTVIIPVLLLMISLSIFHLVRGKKK